MHRFVLGLCLTLSPAFADGGITVKLPDDAAIAGVAKPEFLMQLVQANVVSSNCADFAISPGEWTLLTGTADKIAAVLKLDSGAYDDQFYGPAFASLDKAETCAADGPKVRALLDQLVQMGGGTEAIE
jgi:hypothetical protein